jgi:hypothetical protein
MLLTTGYGAALIICIHLFAPGVENQVSVGASNANSRRKGF